MAKKSSKQIWKEIEAAEKAGIRRLYYKHLYDELYNARFREAHEWSDKAYSKKIYCPESKTKPGHSARLYFVPHKFAGQYECGWGHNDVHEHHDYEIREEEIPSSNPDSSNYSISRYYVCGECGVTIPADVADPDIDREDS